MKSNTPVLTVVIAAMMLLAYGIAAHSQTQDCSRTYANFGKPFFDKYCIRCHTSENHNWFTRRGAPKGYDFDAYEGIQKRAEKIKDLAVTGTKMPKGKPKPTDDERTQLGGWIACGLPQ